MRIDLSVVALCVLLCAFTIAGEEMNPASVGTVLPSGDEDVAVSAAAAVTPAAGVGGPSSSEATSSGGDSAPPVINLENIINTAGAEVGGGGEVVAAGAQGAQGIVGAASAAAGFIWSGSDRLWWKYDCDWLSGNPGTSAADIGNRRGAASECGSICNKWAGCTHFTWTNFNGGTCWIKRWLPNQNVNYAYTVRLKGAICGYRQCASSGGPTRSCVTKLCPVSNDMWRICGGRS